MTPLKTVTLALALTCAGPAVWAHTPLFACFDNGDGTVFCEGGFSDGSSAAGIAITVRDASGPVIEGKMNPNSEFEFDKPQGDYTVLFDAGEGHKIEIQSAEIVE